jgi:glycosidase
VILDLVLNHSSSQHRWFVDASTGPSSPYRDWYVWRGTNPGWTQPWGGSYPTWHLNENDGTYYYGVFWGGMPDLNFTTPAVRAEARRLAALWLDRGADGFRLDATRYLIETGGGAGQEDTPPTHDFWQEFTASVRQHAPDALVVAENWAPTPVIAAYFGSTDIVERGHELPLNFNFPMSDAILDAVRTSSRTPVESVLRAMAALYPDGVRDAPFLTNHDQVRIATQLGGMPGALRSAAAVLLTLPGVPFLYYGEEVGLVNGTAPGDEAKRTPMPWADGPGGGFTTGDPWHPFAPGRDTANVADQTDDPGSLLNHYRGLIHARAGSPALGGGTVVLPDHDNGAVLVVVREHADQRVLAAVNLSVGFQVAVGIAVDGRPTRELYSDGNVGAWSGGPGSWSVVLPPHGTTVWELSAP